ncbi:MAG: sulfotransferase [Methylococcaceae bacterium]|nr:sulfotransferase [Methylococcaceae bacterium]
MALKNDDKSLFLNQLDLRSPNFRRNNDLEKLLDELSGYLRPIEAAIENRFAIPAMPPLFLVGNPRSGTSLFMQFLSLTKGFAVPTNLLSRFYYAPFLGAKIHELLTNPKYDFKNELSILENALTLESDIGKAKGMLAPSEFFHFWRQFLPRYDPQYLDDDDLKMIDIKGLQKGIAAIESVFNRPFAAKAIILQYNLDVLCQAFPDSLIIYIFRKPIYIMQSILLAREKFYGDTSIWWSVKPKEYEQLKDMDIYHQIAGQVYYTEKSIEEQLLNIHENKKLIISYEDFCLNPKAVAEVIKKRYSDFGFNLDMSIDMIDSLESRNEIKIANSEIHYLENAYDYFKSSH